MILTGKQYDPELIAVPESLANEIHNIFISYASSFRKPDDEYYNQHMVVKQDHTVRVCNEIKNICQSLGFSKEQLAFAEVIAWLHDIGRFEQFTSYGTFADAESENHSEIAVRVIESKKLLAGIEAAQREIVYRSILNHNIPQVPAGEPDSIQFYSRLLRDADKLDIWRLSVEMDIFHKIKIEKQPDHYAVPSELLERFKSNKPVSLEQVHSFYDSILYRISWIYDLNFKYSVEQVVKRRIADDLIAKVPGSADLDTILSQVYSYMQEILMKK